MNWGRQKEELNRGSVCGTILSEPRVTMPRCEKLLEKARRSPANVRFGDLRRLVECFGFELARARGSHFNYKVPGRKGTISLQEGKSGKAKRYQIDQVLHYIDRLEDRTGEHEDV